jgi:hypothetical protein
MIEPTKENRMTRLSKISLLTIALIIATSAAVLHSQSAAQPQPASANSTDEIAALRAEVNRLKGIVPDQSHAMKDVAYHFGNLWFAG